MTYKEMALFIYVKVATSLYDTYMRHIRLHIWIIYVWLYDPYMKHVW